MTLENQLFEICKILMLYGGIWMQEMPNWSKFSRKLYKVSSFLSQTLFVSCLPLFSVQLCITFGTDIETGIGTLKNITFVAVICFKMFFIQSKKFNKLIKLATNRELQIMSSLDSEIKRIYRTHVTYAHRIIIAIVLCLHITGYVYMGDGLYRSYSFYKTHQNVTDHTPKPHPVQVWFPFNKNKFYKTAMAYQIMHIVFVLNYNGCAQAVIHSVLVFVKAEMKILQYTVRNINISENSRKTLKMCVLRHQTMARWISEFNGGFQYILLLEYCVTSFTLATILIEILQGKMIAFNMIFFTLSISQLFFLSWNANEILLESSSGLSNAIYDCTWYNLDQSSKSIIKFMIMRCSKPLTISIGPFGSMTIDAAASRLKLSYSVASVFSTTSL
uniref:Odorant receptor n=1 Tax=Eucryptorrhynchus brandti TaxID=436910 RepID=A0A8F4RRB9_EUCBR|nr:odorant receptor 14 [Eucryptorrhynchus brandti]